jgi:hypothetical protein
MWYRVLWYEPNHIAHEERVNVAVFVFGDGEKPRWARLRDWSRVNAFAGDRDTGWDDLIDRYQEQIDALDDVHRYTYYPHDMSVFHMTEPRGTLRDDVDAIACGVLFGYAREQEAARA